MRNLLTLAVATAICAAAIPASAQVNPKMEKKLDTMSRILNLTPDQFKTVRRDLMTAKAERGEIRRNAALTTDQKERRIKDLRQSTRTEIRAVLTPVQLKTWREFMRSNRR